MPVNYLNQSERADILKELLGNEENLRRKEASLMRFEIYKGRQAPFIMSRLMKDIGKDAVQNSRTITSINLTKRIIDEQAAVYKNEPIRSFSNVNEVQEAHIRNLYQQGAIDQKLKKTNRVFKLNHQAALQVVPRDGKILYRPLLDHHYDVVPRVDDPEQADCYIVSSFDKRRLMGRMHNQSKDITKQYLSDGWNQKIAEPDDYMAKKNLFYWWSRDYNFITDSKGNFVNEMGEKIVPRDDELLNPLMELPFIDVARDKDFEYFVRGGSLVVDFSLDLGVMLSDVSEINRLQGFSQAVISSTEEPKDIKIGPRRVLWLKIKPHAVDAERPTFQFASPNPDLASSLKLLGDFTSLFLTSEGMSPKLVNTASENEKYTSGLDRFLSMVQKFEASQDDLDMFATIEQKVLDLTVAWNNLFYNVTENGFADDLSGVILPEDAEVKVEFSQPKMILSETEKLEVISRKKELGLISDVEAIMFDRNVNEETAQRIKDNIDRDISEIINGKD
jgi:hypothetical protein